MPFSYRLILEDGTPADPPSFSTAVPSWHPGDTIPISADRQYRVAAVRDAESPDDDVGVLVVEPV